MDTYKRARGARDIEELDERIDRLVTITEQHRNACNESDIRDSVTMSRAAAEVVGQSLIGVDADAMTLGEIFDHLAEFAREYPGFGFSFREPEQAEDLPTMVAENMIEDGNAAHMATEMLQLMYVHAIIKRAPNSADGSEVDTDEPAVGPNGLPIV